MSPVESLPEQLGLTIVDGPQRVGSELRWRVLADGTPAVLGQLLPELAHDPSLRRRYVRDVERLRALGDVALTRIRRLGPEPDPRDPQAAPPWRLRDDPPGETLEAWLERRAPAPVDEATDVIASVAERLHEIHAHGAVLRDLNPRLVVRGEDGRPWFTDVGLARVDVLSTRTAASLLLEGSPYTAPELLTRTVVDQRADIYGLGVLLYQALVGEPPGGDSNSLLRPPGPAPRVRAQRDDVPAALDDLVARCLDEDPTQRPGSAAQLVDALRGHVDLPNRHLQVTCQACGQALRLGQRLCTYCGQLAVQFSPPASGEDSFEVELRKIDERAQSRAHLQQVLGAIADGPLPALNFIVGDQRMYSKSERTRLIKLPIRLVTGLDAKGANRLAKRLRIPGVQTQVQRSSGNALRPLTKTQRGGLAVGASGVLLAAILLLSKMGGIAGALFAATVAGLGLLIIFSIARAMRSRGRKRHGHDPPLVNLRAAPAALPASDPLVLRLGALLQNNPPTDIREQVGELALAVQRLVDHRARQAEDTEEIDAVTAPVADLVRLVEGQVKAIERIDIELGQLDEGTLVRALAAAEARGDVPAVREELLHGLDRLRSLEDARARRFHRLLEAARLAHRAVELGLEVRSSDAEYERNVAAALEVLNRELGEDPSVIPLAEPPTEEDRPVDATLE